jgi:hypothetical protein
MVFCNTIVGVGIRVGNLAPRPVMQVANHVGVLDLA